VHISALSERFVRDPHQVVKAGDVVKVKVLEVDVPRKRIALTMRLADEVRKPAPQDRAQASKGQAASNPSPRGRPQTPAPTRQAATAGAMAEAFARLKR